MADNDEIVEDVEKNYQQEVQLGFICLYEVDTWKVLGGCGIV